MDRRPSTQTPQVDNTACICRVDGGLKTIAGAKKFVHGGKLCLRPRIKTSIHPTRVLQKATQRKRSGGGHSPFIPGLPDDLAIACLIRVPRSQLQKLRVVCRRWCRLLAGTYLYSLRGKFGLTEEWIYIIKRDKDDRVSWDAFDPVSRIWHPVPSIPTEYSETVGFGCAVLDGSHLYLFGGNDPVNGSMRRVIFYNARTNKWHRAPDMIRRRRFFASCVINNRLYVAGGVSDNGVNHPLTSAEVYDPSKNRWSFISDMTTAMAPFAGVVYDGKWYLKGLGPDEQVLSKFYLPEADRWNPVVLNGMVSGWRNPTACLNGRLYDVDCKDGCKLRCYNEATDSWSKDSDSKMHLGSSRLLEAASLIPLNGKICVIRNNMSISLVEVARTGGDGVSTEQRWEIIAGKGQEKTFFPNLWSNLVSVRSRLKNQVVYSQVLRI